MRTPLPSDPLDALATDHKLPAKWVLSSRYEIVRELGAGGLGIVYLAYDKLLEMEVAIKVLRPTLACNPEAVHNLIKEAKIAMGLAHKNITRVYNFEGHTEIKFLIMEYIDGMTLAEKKRRDWTGKLALDAVVHYVKQVCEGLEYAHEKKIVHRDIKPANLMVNQDNLVKIADFGIARVAQYSAAGLPKVTAPGTLIYMSPEQVMGNDVDAQSDLYSLGVVIYELLSGHPPFYGAGIKHQILNKRPEPISGVPQRINQILLKALEKNKERRWKTARELTEALEGTVEAKIDRKPSPVPPRPPNRSRRLWPWVASGVILVLILAGWLANHKPLPPEGKLAAKVNRQESEAEERIKKTEQHPEEEQRLAEQHLPAQRMAKEKRRTVETKTYNLPPPGKINRKKGSQPSALVVSSLGGGDYKTIGEAIVKARPGMRILVRPGFYTESLTIDKPLEIIGDGPMEGILIESTDASCLQMETDYAVVRGLTLRGQAARQGNMYFGVYIPKGRLVLEDCDISSDSLAGVGIHGATAHPIIRRCKIHDGKQSGIYVFGNGQGTVEQCDIFGNAHSGVAISTGGNPVIRGCKIHNGKQSGIYVYGNGQGTVEECDLFGNAYAGVTIATGGNPIIRRCKIHNEGYNGIHVFDSGRGTIEQCDIFGNGTSGVDIREGGNPIIRRCNINRNKYVAIGAYKRGIGRVEDCDLTGNTRAAWDIEVGSVVQRRGNKE
jgi:parallel beta-helix repeat protein